MKTLNKKIDYFNGIWYMNQPLNNEYKFKYSGGLGTYCAKHSPFAVYSGKADKTFFCYGAADIDFHKKQKEKYSYDGECMNKALFHAAAYFDHRTGNISKPTLILDKNTSDAHDNPVISIDDKGYIWIFSTSHGVSRPSYIHRSLKPFDIEKFERISAFRKEKGSMIPFDNFSYLQIDYSLRYGFRAFTTFYNALVERTIGFISSKDGINWTEWKPLGAIGTGHYQLSTFSKDKIATSFNYHPDGLGLNHRTNLYYIESCDNGETWRNIKGDIIKIPLTETNNQALAIDYESNNLLVFMKDMAFDQYGNPHILYLTSPTPDPGPHEIDRIWSSFMEWKYVDGFRNNNFRFKL